MIGLSSTSHSLDFTDSQHVLWELEFVMIMLMQLAPELEYVLRHLSIFGRGLREKTPLRSGR